jgi:CheY-like chemotaxis protein
MALPDRKTVMIVEDDAEIRDALVDVVEESGYGSVALANGLEALEHLGKVEDLPGVILLDVFMPVMDGWEFRAAQTRDERLSSIPVVALTADARAQETAAAMRVNGYLQKPVGLDELMQTVRQFCGD